MAQGFEGIKRNEESENERKLACEDNAPGNQITGIDERNRGIWLDVNDRRRIPLKLNREKNRRENRESNQGD